MDARRQIADATLGYGDNAGALAAYEQSLMLARRLAEADKGSTNYQSDVSAILEAIAWALYGAEAARGTKETIRRRGLGHI